MKQIKRQSTKTFVNSHKDKQTKVSCHNNSINHSFSQRLNDVMKQIGCLKLKIHNHRKTTKSTENYSKKPSHQHNSNKARSQGFGKTPVIQRCIWYYIPDPRIP